MQIKSRIEFKEYVKLLFSLIYKRPIMKVIVAIAIILLLWIALYYLEVPGLPAPTIYQFITLGLIVIIQPIVVFSTIWINYQSSNHLRERLMMELTPSEIMVTGESFFLEIKWKKMFKIVESDKYFLIYQNNLSAIIIPKKDFKKNQLQEFKSILQNAKGVEVKLKEL